MQLKQQGSLLLALAKIADEIANTVWGSLGIFASGKAVVVSHILERALGGWLGRTGWWRDFS